MLIMDDKKERKAEYASDDTKSLPPRIKINADMSLAMTQGGSDVPIDTPEKLETLQKSQPGMYKFLQDTMSQYTTCTLPSDFSDKTAVQKLLNQRTRIKPLALPLPDKEQDQLKQQGQQHGQQRRQQRPQRPKRPANPSWTQPTTKNSMPKTNQTRSAHDLSGLNISTNTAASSELSFT